MRLFAGIELDEAVREALLDWWHEVHALDRDGIWRPVAPHLWHLTLAFYGEVDGRDADDLAEELAVCAAGSPLLELETCGFGVFPKPARPRAFWAGVRQTGASRALKHLARCCRRAGHATVRNKVKGRAGDREQAFHAHVTMARCGRQESLLARALLRHDLPKPPEVRWSCTEMVLFQSILRPEGPQYRRLERFRLSVPGDLKTGDEDVG